MKPTVYPTYILQVAMTMIYRTYNPLSDSGLEEDNLSNSQLFTELDSIDSELNMLRPDSQMEWLGYALSRTRGVASRGMAKVKRGELVKRPGTTTYRQDRTNST
jgi:hypothetical protein